jgi:membrane-associated phospholipid phosphatase
MGIDQIVLNFFAVNRVEWLSFVMLVITYCGSYIVVSGVTFLSAISFFIHKHYVRILPLIISVCGSALTVFILKNIFDRARPTGAFYLESSFSFPSGHTTTAIALYGFILYVIWKHEKHRLKNPFIIFLSAIIILIGISRLYLGVHYLSDVLAGYTVGLIWLAISAKMENKLEKLFNWKPPLDVTRGK